MFREVQCSTRLFLAIIGASILAIMATLTPTAAAQNSVPPTAVQAAKMPHYASRLAHRALPLLPPKPRVPQRAKARRGPLDGTTIYDNGPADGNTDAWLIDFGFIVSDTFNVAADHTTVTGLTFAAWLFPGDTLTSAELSITFGENGGTSYFDQIVSFTQGSCTSNQYGFNVCTETGSFTGPVLNAGTYWVNLQNASVPSGDPVYWDENSGPSLASQNGVGSIPSESFTILGETSTTTTTTSSDNYACPPPQNGFHDLYDVSGSSAVAVDNAGNLFGTFGSGGTHDQGQVYELAQRAGLWFLSSLYSFLGGSNGSRPNGVIVGPQGNLFGAIAGGTQSCGNDGSSYCGIIYKVTPGPTACATALCTWNEETIYQFTGNTDAWGGTVTAFDSTGNLYGIGGGGAYGFGAVFELSPSQGGWTEKILYSFTGQDDGFEPNSLLVGHDGNLYGTAAWGANRFGVVFQLVPSGAGWTENILYAFTNTTDGSQPAGLVQDPSGNLYGFSICDGFFNGYCTPFNDYFGLVFSLQPSDSGWTFNVIYNNSGDCNYWRNYINALAINADGGLYIAEGGDDVQCDYWGCYFNHCGIVKPVNGAPLISGNANIFWNVTVDAAGKVYGTANTCGFGTLQRTDGMIWQYSP
jgi:hypothetical protein